MQRLRPPLGEEGEEEAVGEPGDGAFHDERGPDRREVIAAPLSPRHSTAATRANPFFELCVPAPTEYGPTPTFALFNFWRPPSRFANAANERNERLFILRL